MAPKDKNVRVHSVINDAKGTIVTYEGYGHTVQMTHYKKETGWYVGKHGAFKKVFAIERCAEELRQKGTK